MRSEVFYSYLKKYFPGIVLSESQLGSLLKVVKFRTLRKGEKIFFGDKISYLFVLLNGRLKVVDSSDEIFVFKDILRPGDFFGDLTLVNRRFSDEFAEALMNNTLVCFCDVHLIRKMISDHPALALYFATSFGTKAKKLEARYSMLAGKDAKERLIHFFEAWAKSDGVWQDDKVLLQKFLSLNDIAAYLSISRQMVYMLLKDLKGRGCISFDKKQIEVYPCFWKEKQSIKREVISGFKRKKVDII
jgi:CRP-like cAMP-binding protein